jgi:hypothetical protein
VNARSLSLSSLCLLALLATGCRHRDPNSVEAQSERRAEVATEREMIEQIPPPSKTRYMSVHTLESWENPYITVQPDMVNLHVLLADANTSGFGAGGMLRPVGARRQELNLGYDKLGEAMSAIPQSSWPYGRVVVLEEAHNTPTAQEHVVRSNMERAIGMLNDLGIEVYDLNDGKLQ